MTASRQSVDAADPPRGRSRAGKGPIIALTVIIFLVPSSLRLDTLASAGRPALLAGIVLFAVFLGTSWRSRRMSETTRNSHGSQVTACLLGIFASIVVLKFALGLISGTSPSQFETSIVGVLRMLSWAGIFCACYTQLKSLDSIRDVMLAVSVLGSIVAALGFLQLLTKSVVIDNIAVPGFSFEASPVAGREARGGFFRPSGTSIHPLEYNFLLTMSFAMALPAAFIGVTRLRRRLGAICAAVTGVACMLSLSRSAVIGAVVVFVSVSALLPRRMRLVLSACTVILIGVLLVAVPRLFGAVFSLFAGTAADPSAASRQNGIQVAFEFLNNAPILGKGLGTFLPSFYIFDNTYVLLALETGLVGLVSFAALIINTLIRAARIQVIARRSGVDNQDVTQSLLAAIISASILLAFFDCLSFLQSASLLFLVLGLAAASVPQIRSATWTGTHSDYGTEASGVK